MPSTELVMTRAAQVAALELASEADPVAEAIGAANTLVRQPGGGLKAYNTDWSAAISAVEAAMIGARPSRCPAAALVGLARRSRCTLARHHRTLSWPAWCHLLHCMLQWRALACSSASQSLNPIPLPQQPEPLCCCMRFTMSSRRPCSAV